MYTKSQIKAIRACNIKRLASLGFEDPTTLYNRIVRFALRRFRWAEADCNGHMSGWQLRDHEHEGELIKKLGTRLDDELREHGLHLTYPGLYPEVVSDSCDHVIELVWY